MLTLLTRLWQTLWSHMPTKLAQSLGITTSPSSPDTPHFSTESVWDRLRGQSQYTTASHYESLIRLWNRLTFQELAVGGSGLEVNFYVPADLYVKLPDEAIVDGRTIRLFPTQLSEMTHIINGKIYTRYT
jgi:hypothetical protein